MNRGRGLSGTHYTNNAIRIADALRYPPPSQGTTVNCE
jgi:hypothetical protein